MKRSPIRAAVVLAFAAVVAGCSGKLPSSTSPTNCRDGCAAMSCPAGTTCTVDGNCAARCQAQPLQRP